MKLRLSISEPAVSCAFLQYHTRHPEKKPGKREIKKKGGRKRSKMFVSIV